MTLHKVNSGYALGSAAHLVMALDPTVDTIYDWVNKTSGGGRAGVIETLEAAANKLREAGLDTSPVFKKGDPKRLHCEEAEAFEADTIFVGARGLSALERFRLGSVSAAVAARAHCSVEVVRERNA